jgi:hypothetical protein
VKKIPTRPRRNPLLKRKNPFTKRKTLCGEENPFAKAKILCQREKAPYPREKSSLGRLKTEKTPEAASISDQKPPGSKGKKSPSDPSEIFKILQKSSLLVKKISLAKGKSPIPDSQTLDLDLEAGGGVAPPASPDYPDSHHSAWTPLRHVLDGENPPFWGGGS